MQDEALIVIDLQNDFLLPEGFFKRYGFPVENLAQALTGTKELLKHRPDGLKVVFTAQNYEPDGADDLTSRHKVWPGKEPRSGKGGDLPLKRGTWGCSLVEELKATEDSLIITKRRFDAFYGTELEIMLRCWGIKTLIIAGITSDVCVETTLRSAFVRDFEVILASEATASWSQERHENTIKVVNENFGRSMSNAEIIARWQIR